MGRTATPQKKTPTTRTLSRASPAPLNFDFGHTKSTSSSNSSTSQPASALPSHLMAGQKRSVEDSPTSSAAMEEKKRTKRAKGGKPKWSAAQKRAAKVAKAAGSEGEGEGDGEGMSIRGTAAAKGSAAAAVVQDDELELSEKEDGEVVEGDFSDLFFMDSAPSAVPAEAAFVEDAEGESRVAAAEEKGETEMARLARERAQEEEDMKVFANEVAMERSSDDSEEDSDEEDEEGGPKAMPYAEDVMYEDEEALQAAIRGKIVDDSAAKVTGRYYKEADLTKSCALCGEQGHSSRDCTHSQCFICGLVDSDHEARNCPVALVCSACGSRGHFARDCTIVAPTRGSSYAPRCTSCSSTKHLTVNCPSLWRVYDKTGAKPVKRKVIFACANDGTTRDHFIDDCPLPRGHPMRYADPSAFNRAALGDAAIGLPGPSSSRNTAGGGATGAASAARRRGGAQQRPPLDEEPADDDWFASRGKGSASGGSGRSTPRGGLGGGGRGGSGPRRGGGGGGPDSGARRTHIHFNDSSHDRFAGSPAPRGGGGGERDRGGRGSGGYRDRDERDDRGGRYDDRERDGWRSMYGEDDRRGGNGGGGSRRGGGSGGGGSGRGGGRGTPSLTSRIEGNGGGSGSRPSPRYQGGYY